METKELQMKREKKIKIIIFILIIAISIVPLFVKFPFRINIFLSWEGAYRMSKGNLPFRDFGIPLGFMYWVVPSIFFKIFGPQLITLIKAQVFLNILSGLAFSSILKNLKLTLEIRISSILLYCISFSFFNFWPWYNHTVIVYEMIALAFLFNYLMKKSKNLIWIFLSALFTIFAFFTKQDAGGLTLILIISLIICDYYFDRKWKPIFIYLISIILLFLCFWIPFLKYDILYWFNLGRPPHTARISLSEILENFLGRIEILKFYLLLITIIIWIKIKNERWSWLNKQQTLFIILVLGILAEAQIFEITSYTPPDNNIFFHSFAFAFIISNLFSFTPFQETKPNSLLLISLVLLWWSGTFWKYGQRYITAGKSKKQSFKKTPVNKENIVNKNTYIIKPNDSSISEADWKLSRFYTLKNIYLPEPTIAGIERILEMKEILRNGVKVLNMTELTMLAEEIPYELERGSHIPLWFHLGVGMFNREAIMFEKRIGAKYYDVVLFENIQGLNNFYPFRIRDSLQKHYILKDSFYAPRRGQETLGKIEVYIK